MLSWPKHIGRIENDGPRSHYRIDTAAQRKVPAPMCSLRETRLFHDRQFNQSFSRKPALEARCLSQESAMRQP
jgi:hypothetical protein